MNIVLDIGHPAHVHYFRNFIKIMTDKGHQFLIIAREKEITTKLLDIYEIPFISRGKGGNGLLAKLLYIPKADWLIYRRAKKFGADLFMSFGSTYAAHGSALLGKPHIAFDDTEHARLELMLYTPFTDVMVNPKSFTKEYGKKQIRFDSFMEVSYLHPKYFYPDENVKNELGLSEDKKYAVLRFVSWGASHDFGHSGIPEHKREDLIELLEKSGYRVFISSESQLEEKYDRYRLPTGIDRIHHVLKFADLFIGESGTMSTEAAILGTPSIYINSLDAGVFQEEVKLGVLYSYRSFEEGWKGVKEVVSNPNIKKIHIQNSSNLMNQKDDVTQLMIDLVKKYQ